MKRRGSVKGKAVKKAKPTKTLTRTDVRKTLLGLAETKRFAVQSGVGTARLVNNYHAYNPLYWIQTGSTDAQRQGDEIYIEKIRLRMNFITARLPLTTASISADPINISVWIIKSTLKEKDGTLGPNSDAFIFPDIRNSGVGGLTNPCIDINKFTAIWGKTYKINCNVADTTLGTAGQPQNQIVDVDEDVTINKTFKYSSTSSGFSEFGNYYIVWSYANPYSQNNLAVRLGYQVDFKDM